MLKNGAHIGISHKRIILLCALICSLVYTALPTAIASAHTNTASLIGPKQYYLALGDSLAFGYQPAFDFNHGYADDFFADLQSHGAQDMANMACPGETSSTMINGGCPYSYLRKYPYSGPQLAAAVNGLETTYKGLVSPVTLDIGANDILHDIDTSTCTVNVNQFNADLATLDANLTQVILPQLQAALTVNGVVTGDLLVMNVYDPYQNLCPVTVQYVQIFNQHIANDVQGFGQLVDVFTPFGGAAVPNANICTYTWMCSSYQDIHAQDAGYSVIAQAFENTAGY